MALDPDYQPILDEMALARLDVEAVRPAELRELMKAVRPVTSEPRAMESVEDCAIDGPAGPLPVRIYRPTDYEADALLPLIVFFHGGGWVIGDLDTHDPICRTLSTLTGSVLVSVDYRLSPESKFPAALNDCYAATEWAASSTGELGADPRRIVVAGDSAGGNLAAAVALMARDREGPALHHQLLIYPVIEHDFDTVSYREFADGYLLGREMMIWFWAQYLERPEHGKNPLAAPIRADSHVGLPAATIVTAELDPLRDEGEAYGRRLIESGVDVEMVREAGQIHGFFAFEEIVPSANRAIVAICSRLRAALQID